MCDDAISAELKAATVTAFAFNRTNLLAENIGPEPFTGFIDIAAAIFLLSESAQFAAMNGLTDEAGIVLINDYLSVGCINGDCLPDAIKSGDDRFLVFEKGFPVEPYDGAGDLDEDGVTNATEFQNVVNAGGGVPAFVAAATDPTLDGTEDAPRGGCAAAPSHNAAPGGSSILMLVVALLLSRQRKKYGM